MLTVYESEKVAAIKSHLSCPLCHQIFTSPCFLSGCGHTFCGLCLRQRFSWRNECPQCKASARPSDLTSSLALNDIVSAYLRFDARAACLQLPPSNTANIPDGIEESSINYSLSSVVEVPGDSDHEGKCSKELIETDSAERTSLTALITDKTHRGEESDEDESVWATAKLPAHRKDDILQVFSELTHRKKKRRTFSNGDIRVFADDNRASTSSSTSTMKPQCTATGPVTAIECSEAAISGTVHDENMDGMLTTKEQCPERSHSSHKNTAHLTHDSTPENYINQIGECSSSGSSLQINDERKDHSITDAQFLGSAARACDREQTQLTNEESNTNCVDSGGSRDWQDSAIKNSAQESITVKDIDMGKDGNKNGTLLFDQNVNENRLPDYEKKSSTTEITNSERSVHSVEELENVLEAIEDGPPFDSPYSPVDLTGSMGANRNHEDVNGSSSKYDGKAAMSDGKECSIEGSQVSLVISVMDNRNDTFEFDNIDINYHDNINKNNKIEYNDSEKIDKIKSNNCFIKDIDRGAVNDGGINFDDSDDDNNNESFDDNDANANTNDISHNSCNQKYDYGNSKCNDNHINSNNNGDNNDQNNDLSNLENNDKNMCSNSDTDAENDSTQASNDSTYTTIRPDALHDNMALSYLSCTESAILLGLKSNDNSSSSRTKSNGDNNNNSCSSSCSNYSNENSNSSSSNNDNFNSSSYSSSSSSQIVDSHSHLINHRNPYTTTTTFSNSTPSSSSIPSSRINFSSDPHSFNSTILPDLGPRSSHIHGLHGRPIKLCRTNCNYDVKNQHNLDGRLDYLDSVLDSQVTVGTDDTSDECHTKNWTQNLDCSANGEDSCADIVDKVRVLIVCYDACSTVFYSALLFSSLLHY